MLEKTKRQKFPVSERALVARINRKLAKTDEQLRRARGVWDGPRWYPDSNLGRYFVTNVSRNWIVDTHVDIEELGRRIDVLKGWEELVEEE